ncbi:MAG: phosphoribosyltransferase [bacterium]|nr:phosphoribosyltransferase [bacterium]
MRFRNRIDGGRQLAQKLMRYQKHPHAVVLGLPRGGVVTAYEVAAQLDLPLDIIVTRKIGAPFNPELAVGALALDGEVVWNKKMLKSLHLDPEDLTHTIEQEKKELARRLSKYRGDRKPLNLQDQVAILVDDGIATGATMRAAIASARTLGAVKVIVASPVAPIAEVEAFAQDADEFVCLLLPKIFLGISAFYEEFAQTVDEEVIDLLSKAKKPD